MRAIMRSESSLLCNIIRGKGIGMQKKETLENAVFMHCEIFAAPHSGLHNIFLPGISELGCLGECLGLERLDLSRNDLSKLYALAGLSKLTYLNLSANRISSLGEFLTMMISKFQH